MENQVFIDRWLILAITYLPTLSKKMIGVGKPYENLLVELLKIDPESYDRFPTDKSLNSKLGITAHFFRKWKHQIYADLVELLEDENNPQFEVKNLEHHITWYEREKAFFFITTLPETPRVGSSFNFDFYRPVSDKNHYYVENISYRLMDGKMIVEVRLCSRFYNAYAKFKEEQEEYEAMQKGAGYWWGLIKKRREAH